MHFLYEALVFIVSTIGSLVLAVIFTLIILALSVYVARKYRYLRCYITHRNYLHPYKQTWLTVLSTTRDEYYLKCYKCGTLHHSIAPDNQPQQMSRNHMAWYNAYIHIDEHMYPQQYSDLLKGIIPETVWGPYGMESNRDSLQQIASRITRIPGPQERDLEKYDPYKDPNTTALTFQPLSDNITYEIYNNGILIPDLRVGTIKREGSPDVYHVITTYCLDTMALD